MFHQLRDRNISEVYLHSADEFACRKQESPHEAGFFVEFVVPGGGIESPTRGYIIPIVQEVDD